jgi:hypothetical protein
MRKLLVTLATCAVALPLQAQLSPEQREAHQLRTNADAATRNLERTWERNSLDGYSSGYGGPTARYDVLNRPGRNQLRDRLRRTYGVADDRTGAGGRVLVVPPTDEVDRGTIGQRQGRPYRLSVLGEAPLDARAEIPLMLTITSPHGGSMQPLLIRAAISASDAEPMWERASDILGDDQGRYRIEVPALQPGRYEVLVEVFDPAAPVSPLSSTRTPLTVWRP